MKLFYLTALDELDREKCGILGKIMGQINSFKQSGIDTYFGHFSGNRFVINHEDENVFYNIKKGNTRAKLVSIYNDVFSFIAKKKINAVYIRFTSLDRKAIEFYKKLNDINVRIVIEFYSHNLILEAKKTVCRELKSGQILQAAKGYASLMINRYYCTKLHNYIDLIVTTTKIGSLYGIQTINVINGIDTVSSSIRVKHNNDYDFNIVSVAMISTWHGYDRVIKGLADYYQNGGEKNVLYTVVGDGEEKTNLEKLVRDLHLQEHVKFTGIKLKDELEEYYNCADVALEMLAGFRRTNGNISSIKMAEYFAKGIPVVYAADSELSNPEIAKYCIYVENNDSNVDIYELIEKCKKIYAQNEDVSQQMHNVAQRFFDWRVTMNDLLSFLLNKEN